MMSWRSFVTIGFFGMCSCHSWEDQCGKPPTILEWSKIDTALLPKPLEKLGNGGNAVNPARLEPGQELGNDAAMLRINLCRNPLLGTASPGNGHSSKASRVQENFGKCLNGGIIGVVCTGPWGRLDDPHGSLPNPDILVLLKISRNQVRNWGDGEQTAANSPNGKIHWKLGFSIPGEEAYCSNPEDPHLSWSFPWAHGLLFPHSRACSWHGSLAFLGTGGGVTPKSVSNPNPNPLPSIPGWIRPVPFSLMNLF